jgi:hypothetical protein
MRKLNIPISLAMAAFAGGCASGAVGLGEEVGTTALPSGLRMLASSEGECGDSVHVGAGSLADARLGPELFVRPGQNATFRVDETPVNWACIDDDSREFHEFDCSDATSHVRITRVADGDELVLECFG